MPKKLVDDSSLTSVADAIRAKGGTSEQLTFPSGFVNAINAITTGSGGSQSSDFSLNLVLKTDVTLDGFSNTSSSTIKSIPKAEFSYPWSDGEHASVLVGVIVRRGGFVAGQPAYSISALSNYMTAGMEGGPSFTTSITYKKDDGSLANLAAGYGIFLRTVNPDSAIGVGARCNTTVPSITGTYDVYLFDVRQV